MRIAFLVNRVEDEDPRYSTTLLAHSAARRGHHVWYLGCEDLVYASDDRILARATPSPEGEPEDAPGFLAAIQDPDAPRERIDLAELDVLMLRNNPADDQAERPWAQTVGILFGQTAAARGVLVLNDPWGLSRALNKMYLQDFPAAVRPATLITRDQAEIREFVKERRETGAILKPLQGSGGQGVFLVRDDDLANLNQIIEAVRAFGYVVAQEYLPAAADGDTRLFLVDGRPLVVDGRICAIRRVSTEGDLRSNMTAGGKATEARVTDRMLELAEIVRPRLLRDGMFLVGLDVAGDRLMEINVFSPGGLGGASHFEGVDFPAAVMETVEAKVERRARDGRPRPDREPAAP